MANSTPNNRHEWKGTGSPHSEVHPSKTHLDRSRITTRKYLLAVDALPAAVIDENGFVWAQPPSVALLCNQGCYTGSYSYTGMLTDTTATLIRTAGQSTPEQLPCQMLNLLGLRVSTTKDALVRELFLQ